jgi:hypothetical protein
MTEEQIITAIDTMRDSIAQYIGIMRMFLRVNVATDADFQRKYNGYYRVRQRNKEWYQTYYGFMESQKGHAVTFSDALRYFQKHLRRYEPSFASKLVATHDPNMPIWDTHVLKMLGLKAPDYLSSKKYDRAEAIYCEVQEWYSTFIDSQKGHSIIRKFDELITEHNDIADIKKIDFVLWKLGT